MTDLTPDERAIYEWQMWVGGFGEAGQRRLKGASVLVSRCGGVGGTAALYLAAAGVGKLVLAHAGNLRQSDLHRQILMDSDRVGDSRRDQIMDSIRRLNPRVELVGVAENISEANGATLVAQADMIVDAAPLFPERFEMNRQAVLQRKPMIEAAMYDLEAQLTTIVPGRTPCLRCIYPDEPAWWRRQFPVFGAVSGSVGCMAAMEAIKMISGVGKPLLGRLLHYDLRDMSFKTLPISRRADCEVCGSLGA